MFELKVLMIQKFEWKDRETNEVRVYYRVWVELPDKTAAYVNSKKAYNIGDMIQLSLRGSNMKDHQGQLQVYTV